MSLGSLKKHELIVLFFPENLSDKFTMRCFCNYVIVASKQIEEFGVDFLRWFYWLNSEGLQRHKAIESPVKLVHRSARKCQPRAVRLSEMMAGLSNSK